MHCMHLKMHFKTCWLDSFILYMLHVMLILMYSHWTQLIGVEIVIIIYKTEIIDGRKLTDVVLFRMHSVNKNYIS